MATGSRAGVAPPGAAPATAGMLLHWVRTGQAVTRKDLQRLSGLSRSTLTSRLDVLQAAGWLAESGQEDSTGGRPARQLRFDDQHAVVLAASIDTMHAAAAVTDLSGRRLAQRGGLLRVADGPGPVLDRIAEWFGQLLAEAGRSRSEVCGVGVSVPGPVDFASGCPTQPPIMPGWDGYPVPDHLARFGGPVLVDNDANLMALGTHRAQHRDCSSLALVKVSTGIGAGLVIDGQVYRGVDGGAGDIGHIRLPGHPDVRCMCGALGCLAAVASGGALAARLGAMGLPTASGSGVRDRVLAGDPEAVRLTRVAGQQVGEVLATLVCVLNPGVLVISGDLAEPHFATGVREVLYQRALPRATQRLRVEIGGRGDGAAIAGACTMVVESAFAPTAVDARLAALA